MSGLPAGTGIPVMIGWALQIHARRAAWVSTCGVRQTLGRSPKGD